jgi:mannose-6-phosphate isomerase-like protein (cupin superfamily)
MITRAGHQPTELKPQMRGGDGTAHLTHVLKEALPEHMRLFSVIRLEPGCSIGYHVHENETELFYFVSGEGQVQDDEAICSVQAGDAMATPSGHGHGVKNTGNQDLVIMAAIVK